ncbi:unnamed protein product [Prorocentrum cordatum]|uniref:PhoD-like phosphatase metallophosphatase domain-containing protein n=1 Tax=Prorocentrum cordatum TaxID=2364126 RepID=A0ABN9TRC1_9DINO|nr:unnamed protein product [Polarella glacialis]
MLGMEQKRTFRRWLADVSPRKWAVVVSSGMLNDYPGDEEFDMSGDCANVDCSSDVWYRYKDERDEIVDMVAGATPNALFLSGDSHYAGMFKLPSNTSNSVLEVSASPLGAFSFLPPDSAVEAMNNGGDVVWIGSAVDMTRVFGEVEISHDMALTARIFSVDAGGEARQLFSHTQQFTDAPSKVAQG